MPCHHPQARTHDGRRRARDKRAGQGVSVHGAPAGRRPRRAATASVRGSGTIIATPILFGLHHRYARIALREHHPRRDPHQHDHDGRNPRDNRPSPPAFFQLAQLALQIHPPSGERVR